MKYVFPRMEQTFQARVEAIEGGIKRAEEAPGRGRTQLLEQYKAQLAEARTEAARIRDEARADAEGIRQDVLAKAREESDRIIAAGRERSPPSGRPSCASCAPRSARSRSTWPSGSSASRWPTRRASAARSSGSSSELGRRGRRGAALMLAASRESYAAAAERLDAYAAEADAARRRRRPATRSSRSPTCCGASRGCAGRWPTRPAPAERPGRPARRRARRQGRRRRARACSRRWCAGRWSTPSELLDATERLGVEALLAGADAAGELAEVEDELFRFGQVVDGDPALAAALGRLDAPASSARAELVARAARRQGDAGHGPPGRAGAARLRRARLRRRR